MPVDDPFDPATPLLTYADVNALVAELPLGAWRQLAEGPIEEDRQCRVCDVLAPFLPVHPTEPEEAHTDLQRAALTLKRWHDDLGRSSWFVDHVEPKMFPGEIERAKAEEKHLFGSIQYARCCLIYALAGQLHLAKVAAF